jgi:hypothetical protein
MYKHDTIRVLDDDSTRYQPQAVNTYEARLSLTQWFFRKLAVNDPS